MYYSLQRAKALALERKAPLLFCQAHKVVASSAMLATLITICLALCVLMLRCCTAAHNCSQPW
jgi:hypothetical protein